MVKLIALLASAAVIPWSSLHATRVSELRLGQRASYANAGAMVVDRSRHAWIPLRTPVMDQPDDPLCRYGEVLAVQRIPGGLAVAEPDWQEYHWPIRTRQAHALPVLKFNPKAKLDVCS